MVSLCCRYESDSDLYDRAQNDQCMRDLMSTDPRHDRARIERSKDNLLRDSCAWILNDPAFLDWRDCGETQLLWIKGDPGKGKTMMMIALTSELSNWLSLSLGSDILSFFFCQSTDARLNSAVSVLRGLVYLLAIQQKSLIEHIRKRYDTSGSQLFEGPNALDALWEIFKDMVSDPRLSRAYILVDALDECDTGLRQLLDLITGGDCKSMPKVKWLVASRNKPEIEERLRPDTLRLKISLELNSVHISHAVNSFISFKVQQLAARKGYNTILQQEVESVLREKAGDTFLWVALVCKKLEEIQRWRTQAALKELPPGLEPLYERMMEQIQSGNGPEDANLCTQILRSATVAYRPLRLQELAAIAHLPEGLCEDIPSITELVELCGSFLTIRDEIIYFVHQSAKDYFTVGKGLKVFPAGVYEEHFNMMCRSLQVMSAELKEDICDLRKPGVLASEVGDKISNSPLVRIEYACCYWANHLADGLVRPDCSQLHDSDTCDDGMVHVFLQQHFLHWLEAMSLLRKMSEAGQAVRVLQLAIKVKLLSKGIWEWYH
jgi:hypothetical protein